MPSTRPPLATWLFICVFGTMIAAVLTCTLIIDRFVREASGRQAALYLQGSADALRDALDRGMAQHYQEVRVMAELEQVARGGEPQAVRRALEQFRDAFPQFAWLGLTDREGHVVAAVDGLLQGVDVSARPWFAGAQHGGYVGDVHEARLLEKLLPARSEPWRFVDVAMPVRGADGELRGILGAHLSWTWAAKMKHELVDLPLDQQQAQALVVSAQGTVLLGPGRMQWQPLEAVGTAGFVTVQSATRGSGPYPGLGWNVVLRQPESVAMAEFRTLHARMLLAATLLCALLAPLTWWWSRHLAAPLRELSAQLGADRAEALRPLARPLFREAEVLGSALARYAEDQAEQAAHLRELNANLELRVEERTASLAHKNGELARAMAERAQSEQRLRTIADNLPVLIAYIDLEERYHFSNATYEAWLDVDPQRMLGRTMAEILAPEAYTARAPAVRRALAGERCEVDIESGGPGAMRHLRTTYVPDRSPLGAVIGVYALGIDVSAMKNSEQQFARLARTDTLTGLPNRHSFNERLSAALARSRRSGLPIALLYLDIDKFKSINDSLGHAAGDEVLKVFAARLSACVRETDTVARLGGDEFVVVLEGLHTPAEPQFIARKIIAAINRPLGGSAGAIAALEIGTSVGIAFQADGNILADALIAAADKALYDAKAGGRNTYRMAAA